ncbi:BAG domain protein [Rhizoctonia solani AG-3 Rhs1AP]|uniref:BAG domain protein n=2 Tax=Rhizoctonia solani AG-3 TaxID=1086053 RepID=A0A074SY57_9AGAM|nr:BAG domain protein [Rhizoctonia solani AG-3 Rhs1AP]KEP54737.1 BAG domain protein [Rhizoctonia solani 123E]
MLVFASHVPAAFSGLGALQSRNTIERPSIEEQYFQALAEEHERAAALARQRVEAARRRLHQQREVEAQLRLQQQLAAVSQVRTPQRSPYQTPRKLFGRTLPPASDVIFEFDAGDNDACEAYAERMHRRSQAALLERQKRAQQQDFLRSLFEEQRRAQAEKVAELHRKRVEEAKLEQERLRKAQEAEQARRHLAARAADEEKLRQFFQALVGAMDAAQTESQTSDLERKNALRRGSVPAPAKKTEDVPAPAPTSASAPTSPRIPERSSSPTPSVASDASDVSLNSIAMLQGKYESIRSGFTFPSELAFAPTNRITPASAPSLLYSPVNAPVHAYENALTTLLTELDAVESFGDEHIRDVRRSLVKSVEAELEALEEKKREMWRNQQEVTVAAPVSVESTPASVESVPVVEPESTPAPAPAVSPKSVSWVAARLAEAPESEDDEVKVVRENLLASLSPADETTVTESQPTKNEVTRPSESEPTVSVIPEALVELAPTPIEPTVESAPEPEVVEAHTPAPVTEAATTEPEATQPAEQESSISDKPATTVPESEPALVESVPETEVAPASPVESEPVSVIAEPEPEIITKHQGEEALAQLESKPETQVEVSAPTKEPTFIQVYPDSDSDSDIDIDVDLASDMGDADKKSGDEFELI